MSGGNLSASSNSSNNQTKTEKLALLLDPNKEYERNKNYEEALKDYVKALGIDHESVAGPGLGTIILNYKFKRYKQKI